MQRTFKMGITIIEVLIVILIIGMLLTLLSPAIESARGKARMAVCANNLRQLGTAFQLHHSAHNHFPTNGWGYLWVGDPDRGVGRDQPGGWIFNILPYIEQADVRQIAARLPAGSTQKKAETARMLKTVVAGVNCPDRRLGGLVPCNDPYKPYNSELVSETSRSDFAANGGDVYCDAKPGMTKGPESFEIARTDKWKNEFARLAKECNGIVHPQSVVVHSVGDARPLSHQLSTKAPTAA